MFLSYSPSRLAVIIIKHTYVSEMHVLPTQIVVKVEELLIGEPLLDVVVVGGDDSMPLAPLCKVKPAAHLTFTIMIRKSMMEDYNPEIKKSLDKVE